MVLTSIDMHLRDKTRNTKKKKKNVKDHEDCVEQFDDKYEIKNSVLF